MKPFPAQPLSERVLVNVYRTSVPMRFHVDGGPRGRINEFLDREASPSSIFTFGFSAFPTLFPSTRLLSLLLLLFFFIPFTAPLYNFASRPPIVSLFVKSSLTIGFEFLQRSLFYPRQGPMLPSPVNTTAPVGLFSEITPMQRPILP